MITKLKIFEKISNKRKFWLLNIKNEYYMLASLKTIKCTRDEINFFTKIVALRNFGENKIYINRTTIDPDFGLDARGYNVYKKDSFEYYSENGYEYMGEIIPSPEELEKVKFEMDVKKYNL